jgi:hypothetical protein
MHVWEEQDFLVAQVIVCERPAIPSAHGKNGTLCQVWRMMMRLDMLAS